MKNLNKVELGYIFNTVTILLTTIIDESLILILPGCGQVGLKIITVLEWSILDWMNRIAWTGIIIGLGLIAADILEAYKNSKKTNKPEDDSKESTEDKTEGDSDNKNNENK